MKIGKINYKFGRFSEEKNTTNLRVVTDFEFAKLQFKLSAKITTLFCSQDIVAFRGSLQELETLNEAGRARLAQLRKCIERLDDWARDENDPQLSRDVDSYR